MRILAVIAMVTGAGLIGTSAGGLASTGEQLRAAPEKCTPPKVLHERDL